MPTSKQNRLHPLMLRVVLLVASCASTAAFSLSGPASLTRAVASSASVAPLRASLAAPSRRAVHMAAGVTMELKGIEKAKQAAGYKSVDDHVTSGMVVGLGTGSTAYFAVERVGQK